MSAQPAVEGRFPDSSLPASRGGSGDDRSSSPDFDRNVFVNCPFDDAYRSLLRPLLFTIISVGFVPRIASERSDSGEIRIEKIVGLIEESRYSIHDLSRIRAAAAHEHARMNMPFELGVDYGARRLGRRELHQKRFLVLGERQYDYMRALSDLSGVDIKIHSGDPLKLVRAVRNWFIETVKLVGIGSASLIWLRFNLFMADFYEARSTEEYSHEDLQEMPVPEFMRFIGDWIARESTE